MRLLFTVTAFLLFSTESTAQQTRPGFSMLTQAPNPASLAISEASASIPYGASSIYINPALLSLNATSTLDLGYSSRINESNYIFGGANFVKGKRAISFGVFSSSVDGIEQRNNPGNSNGDFSVSYLSLSGALAYDFNIFSVGIAGQFLNEENFQYQASGYAFNAGIAGSFVDSRFRAGASILNIGSVNELNNVSTRLPEIFRAGVAIDLFEFLPQKNSDLPVLVSVSSDFVNPLNSINTNQQGDISPESHFNFGLRFNIVETVEISGGYKTGNTARPISFGAGFNTDQIVINYALVPFETGFATLHSIGLQYKF